MIDSILDRATSVLERKFLTTAFLPVLLLPPAVALPSLVRGRRLDRLLSSFGDLPVATKGLIAGGYFTFAWFLAVIVASQWRNIIRLFEGYPLARWHVIDRVGKQWHRARSEEIDDADEHWFAAYLDYPPSSEVLPTRLGNVMRAAERYPAQRYDADLILVWPRLLHILPRESVQDVEEARGTLEFVLVLSLWFVGFATLAPAMLLLTKGSGIVALICFAAGAGGAYAAYLSGISAASEYGEYLRALFDTHRLTLLRRLDLPLPANLAAEREQWQQFGNFVGRGVPPQWAYEHRVANQPET
ncbi:hypothetical protein AB0J83_03335 [Actinoplanes sp. NPDC049596]|uniref:hypothetical protein n=1 Tax=unclassified Actinoplanes TaxID=2626549 RepID=UPI0034492027